MLVEPVVLFPLVLLLRATANNAGLPVVQLLYGSVKLVQGLDKLRVPGLLAPEGA